MKTTPLLINAHEAGRLLQMLTARVVRLAKHGELPCVVLPDGEYRFQVSDLEVWVAEHRRSTDAKSGGHTDG